MSSVISLWARLLKCWGPLKQSKWSLKSKINHFLLLETLLLDCSSISTLTICINYAQKFSEISELLAEQQETPRILRYFYHANKSTTKSRQLKCAQLTQVISDRSLERRCPWSVINKMFGVLPFSDKFLVINLYCFGNFQLWTYINRRPKRKHLCACLASFSIFPFFIYLYFCLMQIFRQTEFLLSCAIQTLEKKNAYAIWQLTFSPTQCRRQTETKLEFALGLGTVVSALSLPTRFK